MRRISRRSFMKAATWSALSLSTCGCHGSIRQHTHRPSAKPNIIFIMADDMGYGDVSCYNPNSKIHTPNIDKLAAEGIRFTDAHSPSAVCTPTRYGVLTGRYCWRTRLKRGVFGGFDRPLIEPDRLTVASFLQQHGYRTACIGKWHLGMDWTLKEGVEPDERNQETVDYSQPIISGPNELGFGYFLGTAGCTTDDPPLCFIENHRTVGVPTEILPHDFAGEDRRLRMVAGWRHEDADVTFVNKSVEFIKDCAKMSDPFFLYLPLSVPHVPWLPPDFVKGKSDAGSRGDQCVLVDWCVERIVAALGRLGISDNTLVILTSDNGPRRGVNGHKSAGNWRGYKSHIWEGGHRVPFIARWPGKIKPGTTSDELICLTDLMATCADIVGADLPANAGQDSYNVLPALLGRKRKRPIRQAIVHHSVWGTFAIRQGPWKLILGTEGSGGWVEPEDEYPEPGTPGQLYNMRDDPYETDNLWDEHPEIVERLTKLLEKYRRQGHSRHVL